MSDKENKEGMVCINHYCGFFNSNTDGFCSNEEEPEIYDCEVSVICKESHVMAVKVKRGDLWDENLPF